MLNFIALAIIGMSIMLAAVDLAFRQAGRQFPALRLIGRPAPAPDTYEYIVGLDTGSPASVQGFDPAREALLIRVPADQADDLSYSDFSTRPRTGGRGQDVMFRGKVFLHLPDIATDSRFDLHVETVGG